MRDSYWILTFLLVLECVVLLIEPAECFLNLIPVSVHTALQILTLLVKIKSIIFKILLGLKLMGVEGFIMRRRRRSLSEGESYLDSKMESLPEYQRTELLLAWKGLERLLGHSVQFQVDACIEATNKFGGRAISFWDGVYLNSNTKASSNYGEDVPENSLQGAENDNRINHSYWVSTVLGSALGSPYACHILENQLQSESEISSPFNQFPEVSNNQQGIGDPPIIDSVLPTADNEHRTGTTIVKVAIRKKMLLDAAQV
ncbi:unnamed protein product [Orchesella dallaii]|uniref:Uncharacterized protein n=1 Tax=Orchesella dallaii TaxID=48710 RepID=A0ABP1Q6M7_9HEXA